MHLTILTPEKTVFEGDADNLQLPGSLGLMGVLNNHAPIITGILPGTLKFQSDNQTNVFFVSSGFFEFNANKALVLTDAAEKPGEIDLDRVKDAEERAKRRLRKRESVDFDRAQRALLRSFARRKAHSF